MVKRSCLALKLMTFAPTGAISRPPRRACPSASAGRETGITATPGSATRPSRCTPFSGSGSPRRPGASFISWRTAAATSRAPPPSGALPDRRKLGAARGNILEPPGGLSRVFAPVRAGNDAAKQFQLDVVGDLMDAVYLYNKYCEPISHDVWKTMRRLGDWVCEKWKPSPTRESGKCGEGAGAVHYFSKLMCWVAVDRALRLATPRSLPADKPTVGSPRATRSTRRS